jgi:hypothetical protein
MVSERDGSPVKAEDKLLTLASGDEARGRKHSFGKATNA